MLNSIDHYQYQEIIYLEQYLYLPSSSLYKKLQTLYKDEYQPNERIMCAINGPIPYDLIAHLQRCIELLNIANCFVAICNTHSTTHDIVERVKNEYSSDVDNIFEIINIELPYTVQKSSIKPLLNPPASMCMYPWTQLYFSTYNIRPCCAYEGETTSNAQQITDFSTSYFSKEMTNLRNDFRQGKYPNSCKQCWNREKNDQQSYRLQYSQIQKDKQLAIDYEEENIKNISAFELVLGNICNLSCRICGPRYSSTWASELIATDNEVEQNRMLLKNGQWPKTNQDFWNQLENFLPQIEYIQFTGGEPLLIPYHWNSLQLAVDQGHAQNISLRYNTNGTITPTQEQFHLWKQFKSVKIDFSIDDIAERYEYQRNKANWQVLLDTLAKFRKHQSDTFTINISVTVSMYNAFYLPELCNWIENQHFDNIWFNNLVNPPWLQISNMTPDMSDQIIKRWEMLLSDKYKKQLKPFVKLLQESNGKYLHEFLYQTKIVDQRRNQNLKHAHKELFLLCEKYATI